MNDFQYEIHTVESLYATYKLSIILSLREESLGTLKSSLANFLPNMKSSYRLEAFARASGFKSWAAVIAAMKAGKEVYAGVSGTKFAEFAGTVGANKESRENFIRAMIDFVAQDDPHWTQSDARSFTLLPMRIPEETGIVTGHMWEPEPMSRAIFADLEVNGILMMVFATQDTSAMKRTTPEESAEILRKTNTKIRPNHFIVPAKPTIDDIEVAGPRFIWEQ